MSNKIDGLSGTRTAQSVVEITTSRGQKARETNGASETTATSQVDRVSLTDTAGDLRAMAKALTEAPPVDSSRVEAVKQAISDGSFRIDARRIAQNLLKMDSELIK